MKIGVVCSDERMMQVADNLKKDYVVYRIQEDTDFLRFLQRFLMRYMSSPYTTTDVTE